MQKRLDELQRQNDELTAQLSQAASTRTTTGVGSSSIPWTRSSVDLHWNEAGELDDMSEDKLPYIKKEWKFQREHFKTLPYTTRVLSHYEAVIRKLGCHLYPNKDALAGQPKLFAPLLKMKIKATWEDWEANNPKMLRAGYQADPSKLRSKELMENQLPWRLEWFQKHPQTVKLYAESPQEMRIDPSYCPWKRRYRWAE